MICNILDLETTGLSNVHDDIVQFAFITIDQDFKVIRAKNCYMYKKGMVWSDKAEAINGLSRKFLSQYEAEFEHNLCLLSTIVQRAAVVGHNVEIFDLPFIKQFLLKNGISAPRESMAYDTMKLFRNSFGKRMKLTKLTEALGITEELIQNMVQLLFHDEANAHNAMYDTVATMLCFKRAVARGLCSLKPVEGDAYELSI